MERAQLPWLNDCGPSTPSPRGHHALAAVADAALRRVGDAGHSERLALTIALVAEFTHAHTNDPLIPPELLPHDWIGAHARARADTVWSTLAAAEPESSIRLLHWYDRAPIDHQPVTSQANTDEP